MIPSFLGLLKLMVSALLTRKGLYENMLSSIHTFGRDFWSSELYAKNKKEEKLFAER